MTLGELIPNGARSTARDPEDPIDFTPEPTSLPFHAVFLAASNRAALLKRQSCMYATALRAARSTPVVYKSAAAARKRRMVR